MPQLADRDTHEQAFAADLQSAFDQQRARLDAAGTAPWLANWSQFRANVQQALQRRIKPIVLSSGLVLTTGAGMPSSSASPELMLTGSSEHLATLHSMQLADEITARSQKALAGGASPDQVFSQARARRIAATETTRAHTQGQRFAAATFQIPAQRPLLAVWRTAIKGVCEFCDRFEGQPEEFWSVEVPGGPPAHEWCRCYLDWE